MTQSLKLCDLAMATQQISDRAGEFGYVLASQPKMFLLHHTELMV